MNAHSPAHLVERTTVPTHLAMPELGFCLAHHSPPVHPPLSPGRELFTGGGQGDPRDHPPWGWGFCLGPQGWGNKSGNTTTTTTTHQTPVSTPTRTQGTVAACHLGSTPPPPTTHLPTCPHHPPGKRQMGFTSPPTTTCSRQVISPGKPTTHHPPTYPPKGLGSVGKGLSVPSVWVCGGR